MIREKSAAERPEKKQAKLPKGVIAIAPPSFRRERALPALPEAPKHVLVDGRDRLATPCDCEAVIGGDGIVKSIAAASIIAKVTRDRLMCALAQECPGYGFETHKGYAVPEHLAALDRLGPSVYHRSFFAPVVAAREKHHPSPIPRDLFSQESQTAVEVSVTI